MTHRSAFPLGREMWKKELSDHQRRLHTVRPTLPAAPTAPSSARPLTHSGRQQQTAGQRLGSPGGSNGQRPASPPSSAGAAAAKGLRIEQLRPEDQSTCHAMIAVLQNLTTADSKSILEELFVGCEMKRLLSQYTGVYPTGGGSADAPPHTANTRGDAAHTTAPAAQPPRAVAPAATRTPPEPRSSSPTAGSLNASVTSTKATAKPQHHSPLAGAAAKKKDAVLDASTRSARSSSTRSSSGAHKRPPPPLAPNSNNHGSIRDPHQSNEQPPPPLNANHTSQGNNPLGQREGSADVASERNPSGHNESIESKRSSTASKPEEVGQEEPVQEQASAIANDVSGGYTPPVGGDSVVEDDPVAEEDAAPETSSAAPRPPSAPQPPSERSKEADDDYGDESFDQ